MKTTTEKALSKLNPRELENYYENQIALSYRVNSYIYLYDLIIIL